MQSETHLCNRPSENSLILEYLMNTYLAAGLPAFDKSETQVLRIQEYRRFIQLIGGANNA